MLHTRGQVPLGARNVFLTFKQRRLNNHLDRNSRLHLNYPNISQMSSRTHSNSCCTSIHLILSLKTCVL